MSSVNELLFLSPEFQLKTLALITVTPNATIAPIVIQNLIVVTIITIAATVQMSLIVIGCFCVDLWLIFGCCR